MSQPKIETVDASIDFQEIVGIIDRDGAIVLSGLLPASDLRDLREELDQIFNKADYCDGPFYGSKTKRIHSLVAKSQTCRNLILEPLILKIMNHILGPSCEKIQLNLTQGIQIWPGEKLQALHRDDDMYPMKEKSMELMIDVMWAYSDFTKQNGATVVVPGSHKWDRQRKALAEETTQAEMAPGEALIYLGSALHSGGENRSTHPRTGVLMGYCLGWLRQFENQYLAAPPEISKEFPKVLQDLLGYCVHRPNLGLYEGNQPSVLFDMPASGKIITRDWLTPEQYDRVRQHLENQALPNA